MKKCKLSARRILSIVLSIVILATMANGLMITGFATTTLDITNVTGLGCTWGSGTSFASSPTGDANGYNGSYWFRLTGQSNSFPQYKIGLPAGNYNGLKKISYWAKATGDMIGQKASLGLMTTDGTALLTSNTNSATLTADYVYNEFTVTDKTGQDFSNLAQLRAYLSQYAKTGAYYISNLQFTIDKEPYAINYTLGGVVKTLHQFPGVEAGYGTQSANALTVNVNSTGVNNPGNLTIAIVGTNGSPDDVFTPSATSVNVTSAAPGTFTIVPRTGLPAGDYSATVTISNANTPAVSFNLIFTVAAPFVANFMQIDNAANKLAAMGAWTGIDYYSGEDMNNSYIITSVPNAGSGLVLSGGAFNNGKLTFTPPAKNGSAILLDYKNVGGHTGRATKTLPNLDYSNLITVSGDMWVTFLVKSETGAAASGLTLTLTDANNASVASIGGMSLPAGDNWTQIKYKVTQTAGKKIADAKNLLINTSPGSSGKVLISDIVFSNCEIADIDLTVANTVGPVEDYTYTTDFVGCGSAMLDSKWADTTDHGAGDISRMSGSFTGTVYDADITGAQGLTVDYSTFAYYGVQELKTINWTAGAQADVVYLSLYVKSDQVPGGNQTNSLSLSFENGSAGSASATVTTTTYGWEHHVLTLSKKCNGADTFRVNQDGIARNGKMTLSHMTLSSVMPEDVTVPDFQVRTVTLNGAAPTALVSGDNVVATKVFNNVPERTATLIVALYDSAHKLVDFKSKAVVLAVGDNTLTSDTLTVPAGSYSVKSYIWDGFVSMSPLASVLVDLSN